MYVSENQRRRLQAMFNALVKGQPERKGPITVETVNGEVMATAEVSGFGKCTLRLCSKTEGTSLGAVNQSCTAFAYLHEGSPTSLGPRLWPVLQRPYPDQAYTIVHSHLNAEYTARVVYFGHGFLRFPNL
jgi:hypothetical protein